MSVVFCFYPYKHLLIWPTVFSWQKVICLLWTRTLGRTTFKMSSFTRLQTYRSSWCSQAQGKSQLLLAHLGFWRGGWSLRSYSARIHEEPHHVTLWKILNVAMSQFHVLQNGFNWHFKGWWWAHVNLLTKILAYMRTWVMITSVITMIHKLYSSLQSLTLLVFLQSETVGSPGSCSTLESFFPQLWGCHLSVIFLSLVPSTFFFYLYFLLFRTCWPYSRLCP